MAVCALMQRDCCTDLFQMVTAFHSPRRFASRLDGGKNQRYQGAYDGDND
jgi:hypothetical protein